MKTMKILVTGGAGFIGSHVVDAYVDAGYDVVVIDDLSTGKKENIHQNAVFYEVDITDAGKIKDIFKKEKPDIVNHHAAQVDVNFSMANAKKDAEINIGGTINLLHLSKEYGIKRFIFASSAAVYGEARPPIRETVKPEPISPYGASKHAAELYVAMYRKWNITSTILRYPNVYGPRQGSATEGGVVSIFTKNMLSNKPVTIYGDGSQTRDFIFVKDVKEANLKALSIGNNNELNISTGKSYSVNKIFDYLRELIGYEQKPKYAPRRAGDIKESCLDCSLAKSVLQWTPQTDLYDGLRQTIDFFKNEAKD